MSSADLYDVSSLVVLQLLLDLLHNNNTEFVGVVGWGGGMGLVASYQLAGHSQLMLWLSWAVTKNENVHHINKYASHKKYVSLGVRVLENH